MDAEDFEKIVEHKKFYDTSVSIKSFSKNDKRNYIITINLTIFYSIILISLIFVAAKLDISKGIVNIGTIVVVFIYLFLIARIDKKINMIKAKYILEKTNKSEK